MKARWFKTVPDALNARVGAYHTGASGYLYCVILGGGWVKVGCSRNPSKRIYENYRTLSKPVLISVQVDNYRLAETLVHRALRPLLEGPWSNSDREEYRISDQGVWRALFDCVASGADLGEVEDLVHAVDAVIARRKPVSKVTSWEHVPMDRYQVLKEEGAA